MSLFRSFRRRIADRIAPASDAASSRRQFFRRAAGAGAAALGAGLLIPEEAWAGVEERSARFGIAPGTTVDAQGRQMTPRGMEPFIGEIMLFGGNFAPRSFALCQGQLLPIAQNSALFSILGTLYGGDGRTTFGLPDLRGRVPVQQGQGPGLASYRLGEKGGRRESHSPRQRLRATPILLRSRRPSWRGARTSAARARATSRASTRSRPTPTRPAWLSRRAGGRRTRTVRHTSRSTIASRCKGFFLRGVRRVTWFIRPRHGTSRRHALDHVRQGGTAQARP